MKTCHNLNHPRSIHQEICQNCQILNNTKVIYEEINACVISGQIAPHVRAVRNEDDGEM